MLKVLITLNSGVENLNKIKQQGYEVISFESEKEIAHNEDICNIDILVCNNPFNYLDISMFKKLKWIQLNRTGTDDVPLKALRGNNITLTNVKGAFSIPIAEWIILKILEIYKNNNKFYQNKTDKKWVRYFDLQELCGKKVCFIGTGSIATETAKRLKNFGVDIYGINTTGSSTEGIDKCYSIDKLDEVIEFCDIIVITIPLTEKTYHLINKDRLRKMKNDAVLLNVSRGSIIDEQALIELLKAGCLLGVGLDVFENEPLDKSSLLWELENVYITPHNSFVSEMMHTRIFEIIYENLKRYKEGNELLNVVDLYKGY